MSGGRAWHHTPCSHIICWLSFQFFNIFFYVFIYLFIYFTNLKKPPLPLIRIAVLYMVVIESLPMSCMCAINMSVCPVMKAFTVSYDNSNNTRGEKRHMRGEIMKMTSFSSIDSFTFTLSNHLFLNILLHTQLQSMNIFVSLNVHKNIVEYITSKWHH